MSKALSITEQRNDYYGNIKLGNDLNQQTQMIQSCTKQMIKAQAKVANEIVSSQNRIKEGVDILSYQIEDVANGMQGLKAAFEFGISEVVWQIEQNREVLKNILEVLLAPLDTQAKELRKRAEEAYSNGWIDEALDDFLKSEIKNKYDFSVHISIGIIYLFSKKSKEKSIEYFEKAIKYSKPKSPYHTSFALLHAAAIKFDFNLIEDAEQLSNQAVELSPDFSEAFYQNALYNSYLSKPEIAIPRLKKAISFDINYCEKIINERGFDNIFQEIEQMFHELRNIEKNKALKSLNRLNKNQEVILSITEKTKDFDISISINNKIINNLNKVKELIGRNSYRDYVDANSRVVSLTEMQNEELDKLMSHINININNLSHEIYKRENEFNTKAKEVKEKFFSIELFGYASLIPSMSAFVACLLCFFDLGGSIGLYLFMGFIFAVACAIPLIGHIYLLMGFIQLFFGFSVYKDEVFSKPYMAYASILVTILFLIITRGYPSYIKEEELKKCEEYKLPLKNKMSRLEKFQSEISHNVNKQYNKNLF